MSEWIKCSDRLPEISYLESDNPNDPYEAYPNLLYSPERPGIFCVGHLIQNQDEESWNFEEFYWELYIPGEVGHIIKEDLEVFTHWMPLPSPPTETEDKQE